MPVSSPTSAAAPAREADAASACEVTLLGFRARVTGPAALMSSLRAVFPVPPEWASQRVPGTKTMLRVERCADPDVSYQVTQDGALLRRIDRADEVVAYIEWAINSAAVRQIGGAYHLYHAGAVALAGRALILPAASGSGKTSLVAALVASGLQYLSDEIAVVGKDTYCVLPFAKSLCVKEGARVVLAPLYPELSGGAACHRFGGERVWYLQPPAAAWPPAPVPVRYVVLPRYVAGGSTTLARISRSTALQQLLEQSFNARALGPSGVSGTVDMLRGADCYALTVADLHQAVDLLRQLASS